MMGKGTDEEIICINSSTTQFEMFVKRMGFKALLPSFFAIYFFCHFSMFYFIVILFPSLIPF
jgi:hypothetical protein